MAKLLPHLFARWRDPQDLEILANLPDGVITLDALTGTARHDPAGSITLRIAKALAAELADQLLRKGIVRTALLEARLTVTVESSRVKTDRNRIIHFDFGTASLIRTQSATYSASQYEEHVWHDRQDP
ncbi:MAG: hypothetical protein ABIW76_04075 [Fibrobacteria bacterium]